MNVDLQNFSTSGHFDAEANIASLHKAQVESISFAHATPSQPRKLALEIARELLERDYPAVSLATVIGRRRTREIVRARWACWKTVHEERPDLAVTTIARIFKRDHTTVMHGLGLIKKNRRKAQGGRGSE